MTNQQTTPEPTVEARRQEIVRLMNRTLIRDCLAIGAIIDEMLRDKDAAIEALRAELAEVRKLSPDADKALTEYALYLLNERPECAKAVDEAIQHIQGDERDRSTNRAYGYTPSRADNPTGSLDNAA